MDNEERFEALRKLAVELHNLYDALLQWRLASPAPAFDELCVTLSSRSSINGGYAGAVVTRIRELGGSFYSTSEENQLVLQRRQELENASSDAERLQLFLGWYENSTDPIGLIVKFDRVDPSTADLLRFIRRIRRDSIGQIENAIATLEQQSAPQVGRRARRAVH